MPAPPKNPKFELCEQALIKECAKHSGPAIAGLNLGHANFATTYRSAFLVAVSDLYRLYVRHKTPDPKQRLSEKFINGKIFSCRGVEMTVPRVKYLLDKHVLPRFKDFDYEVLDQLVKQKPNLREIHF
jgi:hypothetical protein